MIHVKEIPQNELNIIEYYSFKQKSLFTTKEWLSFINEDSKAEPLFLRITDDGNLIGYFTCLITTKYGVRIAGSPFSGWSTVYMGFDCDEGVKKIELIPYVRDYLFKYKNVLYMEITDRYITVDESKENGYETYSADTLVLKIDRTDEELFKVFKTDCRNFIRQFERRGAIFERAVPNEKFAEEYYAQLVDVFAKQKMVPTYSCEKVKCLLRNLKDGENVLCLRVRHPETGESIATSIFLGYNGTFYFWGGASYRAWQKYRPNEYMIWQAIRFWREKGYHTFDMVGVRDYKKKFGSERIEYAQIILSKYKILIKLRNIARTLYYTSLEVKGKLLKRK